MGKKKKYVGVDGIIRHSMVTVSSFLQCQRTTMCPLAFHI